MKSFTLLLGVVVVALLSLGGSLEARVCPSSPSNCDTVQFYTIRAGVSYPRNRGYTRYLFGTMDNTNKLYYRKYVASGSNQYCPVKCGKVSDEFAGIDNFESACQFSDFHASASSQRVIFVDKQNKGKSFYINRSGASRAGPTVNLQTVHSNLANPSVNPIGACLMWYEDPYVALFDQHQFYVTYIDYDGSNHRLHRGPLDFDNYFPWLVNDASKKYAPFSTKDSSGQVGQFDAGVTWVKDNYGYLFKGKYIMKMRVARNENKQSTPLGSVQKINDVFPGTMSKCNSPNVVDPARWQLIRNKSSWRCLRIPACSSGQRAYFRMKRNFSRNRFYVSADQASTNPVLLKNHKVMWYRRVLKKTNKDDAGNHILWVKKDSWNVYVKFYCR